jgi:hypothetical protein
MAASLADCVLEILPRFNRATAELPGVNHDREELLHRWRDFQATCARIEMQVPQFLLQRLDTLGPTLYAADETTRRTWLVDTLREFPRVPLERVYAVITSPAVEESGLQFAVDTDDGQGAAPAGESLARVKLACMAERQAMPALLAGVRRADAELLPRTFWFKDARAGDYEDLSYADYRRFVAEVAQLIVELPADVLATLADDATDLATRLTDELNAIAAEPRRPWEPPVERSNVQFSIAAPQRGARWPGAGHRGLRRAR